MSPRSITWLVPVFAAVGACSPAQPAFPTEGTSQKAIMDLATTTYAECITRGAADCITSQKPLMRPIILP